MFTRRASGEVDDLSKVSESILGEWRPSQVHFAEYPLSFSENKLCVFATRPPKLIWKDWVYVSFKATTARIKKIWDYSWIIYSKAMLDARHWPAPNLNSFIWIYLYWFTTSYTLEEDNYLIFSNKVIGNNDRHKGPSHMENVSQFRARSRTANLLYLYVLYSITSRPQS